jgi:hypothetical protein
MTAVSTRSLLFDTAGDASALRIDWKPSRLTLNKACVIDAISVGLAHRGTAPVFG